MTAPIRDTGSAVRTTTIRGDRTATPDTSPAGAAGPERAGDGPLLLLGFVRAASWPALQRRLHDVSGGPAVRSVPYGFLTALYRPAGPLGLLDGDGQMVRDLRVLGPVATEHEGLLKAIQERGPLFPVGLGSFHSGEGALEALVASRQAVIASFLERVDGHREWQLRVIDTAPSRSSVGSTLDVAAGNGGGTIPGHGGGDTPAVVGSGAGYLAARRRALRSAADGNGDSRLALVESCLRPLDLPTWEWRRLSPNRHSRALLSRAALVPDRAVDDFLSTTESRRPTLLPHHLDLQVTGPFPPYSFVPDLGREG